ncbi:MULTISPECIES: peptidoglycan-associated lipoprotein Pal [unclassified Haematospirillum]|uniref:peptidoglycan-associated lipoprotein Pal n=1 Tax=unclassified Haematospirillum TaxID=2622088 RepID=UPI00143881DE|nr:MULTISPECIES: peptidoglycan-associated lipoprotein Pal [unclassified Haematospirillum]NKD54114.1 peptidoglycan-associated lipoprotein Pal [Haematospirillum sp. H4890]NKD74159.1 peptidoglycan-associated lipoprotein Pal [Haematospirillum sp. H4485]NKD87172.1 peptidoglycan-associated lipoprotein Pal [Haematospirillum sp. 15-248]
MKFRLLPVLAAVALLSACGTASDESASGSMGKAAPAPGSVEEFMTVVGDRVHFGFDKYTLTPEAQATLRNQAAWLKRYSSTTLMIEGHADERGTREYNLGLGERRANSVKKFLIAQGVSASRLKVTSYGKERPECGDATEACYTKNRRGVSVLH